MKERGRPELRDDVEIGTESRREGGDMHNRCIMYFNSLQFSYYYAEHLILCVCAKINGQFPRLSIESWAASSSEVQFLPVYIDLDALCWISHCPPTSCELWIANWREVILKWPQLEWPSLSWGPNSSKDSAKVARNYETPSQSMLVHELSIQSTLYKCYTYKC